MDTASFDSKIEHHKPDMDEHRHMTLTGVIRNQSKVNVMYIQGLLYHEIPTLSPWSRSGLCDCSARV